MNVSCGSKPVQLGPGESRPLSEKADVKPHKADVLAAPPAQVDSARRSGKAVHELRAAEGDDKLQKVHVLRLLARKLVNKALEGDVAALKEIGDRLDGKPAQAVDVEVALAITTIERRIVDPVKLSEVVTLKAIEDQSEEGESG